MADVPVADAAVDDGKGAERLDAEPDFPIRGFLGNLDVPVQKDAAGLTRQGQGLSVCMSFTHRHCPDRSKVRSGTTVRTSMRLGISPGPS